MLDTFCIFQDVPVWSACSVEDRAWMRPVFTDNVLPTKIRSFLNLGEGGFWNDLIVFLVRWALLLPPAETSNANSLGVLPCTVVVEQGETAIRRLTNNVLTKTGDEDQVVRRRRMLGSTLLREGRCTLFDRVSIQYHVLSFIVLIPFPLI